ncbi:MAG TPA: TonB family protein [Bryobacteraceae bacterium]|nr:TonB family protein [Bryobacteraceae bacterium]
MNTRFPIPLSCRSPLCRALTYLLVACYTAGGLRADFRKSAEFAFQSTPDGTKLDSPPPTTSGQAVPPPAGGVFRVGGGVSPPRVIYKKDPGYSEEARKAHLWGTIVLQVIVGADGVARDIKVVRPLGMGLDEMAVETVAQWRFQPGTKQGNPVNVMATIEVNFRLLDQSPWRIGRLVFVGGGSSRPVLTKWHLPNGPVPDRDLRITFKVNVDNSGNVTGASVDGVSDPVLTAALQEAVLKWKFRVPDRSNAASYSAALDLTHGNPMPVRISPASTGEIHADPKNAEEAYREGVRLTRAQAPEQAIPLLTKAIQEKPEWGAAYSARAQAYYNMQRYHEAVDDLTVAIRLNPNQASLYDRRGLSYSYAGRHDIAIDDYNRAIELSGTPSSQYYNNRGWAYCEMGQLDKALADLNRALEIAPDFGRAFGNRGDAYMKMKDYSHAVADFTAALQLTTTRSLFERRAEAKRLSGDEAGAAEDLKRAGDLPPTPAR